MTRTVLTLTTSPQRMQHLPLVLDALFNQLTSPDAVYLNLPERYRNRDAYIIPDWLGDALQVTLLHRVDDLGPVMKILPVLEVETDSDTLLITVDDDVRYPPDTISALQTAAQAHPESACGSRGFNFTISANIWNRYEATMRPATFCKATGPALTGGGISTSNACTLAWPHNPKPFASAMMSFCRTTLRQGALPASPLNSPVAWSTCPGGTRIHSP